MKSQIVGEEITVTFNKEEAGKIMHNLMRSHASGENLNAGEKLETILYEFITSTVRYGLDVISTDKDTRIHKTKDGYFFYCDGIFSKENKNYGSNQILMLFDATHHKIVCDSIDVKNGDNENFILNDAMISRYCEHRNSGGTHENFQIINK